jgi:hypothetical protein
MTQQTAQEQAALIIELSDSYALAQIAVNLPGAAVIGVEQVQRLEGLTIDLINAGYLPKGIAEGTLSVGNESYSTGAMTTGAISHTGGVYSAVGKGLLALSKGAFNWIAKNPGVVLAAGTIAAGAYITHSYLSQPLEMKVIEARSATEQVKAYVGSASQGAIDAALKKTAMTYAQAGSFGFAGFAKWLIPLVLLGGGAFWYFSQKSER